MTAWFRKISFANLFFGILLWICFSAAAEVSKPSLWNGPKKGPVAQTPKEIYFIASDLRNGGVLAVKESFLEASQILKWKVQTFDGAGIRGNINKILEQALKSHVDGIVLGGFDAGDYLKYLKLAAKRDIKVVGWHASSKPGPSQEMFTNVTTDPLVVAQTAAESLQHFGAKKGGVIILTDRRYSIATAKAIEMKKTLESMPDFKVISVEDLPISAAEKEIQKLVRIWNQRYGKAWTHTLAINDIYFTPMRAPLQEYKRDDVVNIAAGDGDKQAIQRIKEGKSQQLITVAEPLKAQGWQIADELNRAFAGHSPSGYLTELIVVTKDYLSSLKSDNIEENLDYKKAYSNIWNP